MGQDNELDKARKAINEIDVQMAELFERRMQQCREVAEYKIRSGLSIIDDSRERAKIENACELVEDSEKREFYVLFQKYLMGLSKDYQRRLFKGMKIAYCGVSGDFAHNAAQKAFPEAETVSFPDFAEAYSACVNGDVDVAILPIENSPAGDVGTVIDLAYHGDLYINSILDVTAQQSDRTSHDQSRFAVFSRSMNNLKTSGHDTRFILVFAVRNEAGALAKALNIIGAHGYNMSYIHSRPSYGPDWNHYFFVELEGDVTGDNGKELLRQMKTVCDNLRLVGSYRHQEI